MVYKVVVIAALSVSACTSVPYDVSKFPSKRPSNDATLISLNPKDLNRVDTHFTIAGTKSPLFGTEKGYAVATGTLWRQVFIGDPTGKALLTIDNAALYDSLDGMGFVLRETYKIDAKLSFCGQQFEIHAEGTRAAAMAVQAAAREAIEQGISNTAAKAKSVMAQCK